MAKGTTIVNMGIPNDTDFRLIVSTIETVLEAGFTRTADTGQINTTTVTRISSAISGYGMFAFNDSLQATKPVVFKIEYGTVTTTGIDLWLTVGTGSDGAGNITGIILARARLNPATSFASSNTTPLFVSAKNNWFCFDFQNTSTTGRLQTSLERSLDVDGTSNGNGIYSVIAWFVSNVNTFRGQFLPFTGTVPPPETVASTNPPSAQTSGLASDNSIAVFPLYFYGVGRLLPPSRVFCGVFNSNITQGVESQVEVSGQLQNMVGGQNHSWMVNPAITNYSYLMRYEA